MPSSYIPNIAMTASERETILEILRQHVSGREVWVFGSRATGKTKPYSDLDLAIGGDGPLPLSLMGALRDAFDESALSYKVDIVELATISPEFRRGIEGGFVLLRAAER